MYHVYAYRSKDSAGQLVSRHTTLPRAQAVAQRVANGGQFADVKQGGLHVVFSAKPKQREERAEVSR
jgi:hypothetical protein